MFQDLRVSLQTGEPRQRGRARGVRVNFGMILNECKVRGDFCRIYGLFLSLRAFLHPEICLKYGSVETLHI